MKSHRVSVQAGLDGPRPLLLVLQVVGTVVAITIVAEFAVGKTVTVPGTCRSHNGGGGDDGGDGGKTT